MWHKRFRRSRSLAFHSPKALRLQSRPALEALEDRWLPSTFHWANSVDGNFNNPAMWLDQNNKPGVPGAGDTATISSGTITVTISDSESVYSLTDSAHTVVSSGASLTVGTGSSITGPLDNAGTVNVNAGTLTVSRGGNGNGVYQTAAGAVLKFSGVNPYNWNSGTSFTGSGLLDVTGAVTSTVPLTVASFQLDAGANLVDNGGLTISSGLTWTGGTLGGSATTTLTAGCTTTVNASSVAVDTGHVLANAGTLNWTAGAIFFNSDTATFNNQAGATFNASCDNTLGAGNGTFNNTGTFTKTSPMGTGTTVVNVIFNNSNTVNLQSGILNFQEEGLGTGAFNLSPGTTLSFTSENYTINAGTNISGTGLVDVASTVTTSTPLAVANLQMDQGGDLVDNGNLTVSNSFNWTGGTLGGSGTTTLAAGSTTTLNSTGNVTVDTGHSLVNVGTVNWSNGALNVSTNAVFTNQAGATFNASCDNTMGGSGTFSNTGTFTKTSPVGTGTTQVSSPTFNSTGTVSVQSGTLALGHGGTASGAFSVAAGAGLTFPGNTYNVNAGASFTGAGIPDVTGGTVNVNGNVSAANFEVDSGSLTGTGTLTTTDTFTWTGGQISDTNGHFTMPAGSTLNIQGNSDKSFSGGTMNLSGTTNWTDSGNVSFSGGATISNKGGATFNIQNDQQMTGSGTFSNAGLLTKVGGTATTTIAVALNNSGKVEVHANTLNVTGSVAQVAGTTLTGGTWSVFGSKTVFSTLTFAGPNLTALNAPASVTLNGLNTTFSNLSALAGNAGSFSVLGGQTFTTAGSFTNTGTLTVGPASVLAVNGSFNLTAAGTLVIQMGGTNTKPTIGKVTVAAGGTMTLAGTLSMTSKIKPAIGTSFTIGQNNGSSPISGTFASLPEGSTILVNGCTYRVSYVGGDGNDVTLTRIS